MGYRRMLVAPELVLAWSKNGEHRELFSVENGIPRGAMPKILDINVLVIGNCFEILMSHPDWPSDVDELTMYERHEGGYCHVPEIVPVFTQAKQAWEQER